jgi:hypothetical protein
MRKVALLTFSALMAAGFATSALADTMQETIGNTVVATNDKGEVTKIWFKADGTYSGETAKGEKFTGHWAIKDGKYCSIGDLPASAPPNTPKPTEMCQDYQGNHKAGDKWTQNDSAGKPITIEIKKGM